MSAVGDGWVVRAPGKLDRIEASFAGAAYAPHRHDTYAIGVTLAGVQSFDYRGATRRSLPGQVVVLHPDEVHDGRAGDDERFRYRTAYVAPADIQGVLQGRALPFVEGGVSSDARLKAAVGTLLADLQRPLTELAYQDALYDVATALEALSGPGRTIQPVNRQAALSAREFIDTRIGEGFTLGELEGATQRDRWQLSRDFRSVFGTSPYRYLTLRRLDRARRMMLGGATTAQCAHACGFADQSHFGRVFKSSFGLTPNAWLKAIKPAHDRSISP